VNIDKKSKRHRKKDYKKKKKKKKAKRHPGKGAAYLYDLHELLERGRIVVLGYRI
jgi:hypothetical protein